MSFCSIYSPGNPAYTPEPQLCILLPTLAAPIRRPHSNIENLTGVIYGQQIIRFQEIVAIVAINPFGRLPARQQYLQRDHRDP
jgi:hypothetical protein